MNIERSVQKQSSLLCRNSHGKYPKNFCSLFPHRFGIIFLASILLIGLGLRVFFLKQPMRYDESFTFLNFVNREFKDLFYYPLPNNHVLHTLLVKVSILTFNSDPAYIRLPSLLAGIFSIPVTFIICRRFIPENSGYLASALMAVNPFLVLYSTMARGYSLMVLLSLLLILSCHIYIQEQNRKILFLVIVIASLGMMTIPSMLLAVSGIYIWTALLTLKNGRNYLNMLRNFLIPASIYTLILTAVLYIPTIIISGGITGIIDNRFVQSSEWPVFLGNIYPHVKEVVSDFSRDIPPSYIFFSGLFIIIGIVEAFFKNNYPFLLLMPCIVIGAIITVAAKHRIPFVRTWIYFIPIIIILIDGGFAYAVSRLSLSSLRLLLLLVGISAFWFSSSLISGDMISKYPDTGLFPEAPILAQKLLPVLNPYDNVYAKVPADWPTYFYLWYFKHEGFQGAQDLQSRCVYIIEDINHYNIMDNIREPISKVFEINNAAIYKIDSRCKEGDL